MIHPDARRRPPTFALADEHGEWANEPGKTRVRFSRKSIEVVGPGGRELKLKWGRRHRRVTDMSGCVVAEAVKVSGGPRGTHVFKVSWPGVPNGCFETRTDTRSRGVRKHTGTLSLGHEELEVTTIEYMHWVSDPHADFFNGPTRQHIGQLSGVVDAATSVPLAQRGSVAVVALYVLLDLHRWVTRPPVTAPGQSSNAPTANQ